MRLLVVEDDAALARGLTKALRSHGLTVDHVSCGRDTLQVVQAEPYSAIILDLGLPDMDGLVVLRDIRRLHVHTPILILTARDATNDRVQGLNQGADDYLSKPFSLSELEARVRALVRRGNGNPEPTINLGPLKFDRSTGAIYADDLLLDLTPRERSILEVLMTRAGNVVPRTRLSSEIFGFDDAVAPNALDVCIGRLRRKLADSAVEVVTIRGLGYLMRLA